MAFVILNPPDTSSQASGENAEKMRIATNAHPYTSPNTLGPLISRSLLKCRWPGAVHAIGVTTIRHRLLRRHRR